MRTECCQCRAVIVPGPESGPVSHGLCSPCSRRWLHEWLEGLDALALHGALRDARADYEAASRAYYSASGTVADGEALAEARAWLADVEVEVGWRGGEM